MSFSALSHYLLLATLIFFFSKTAVGQEKDSVQRKYPPFQEVVRVNRPLSYITFGEGFGNLEPLIFEAQISPSFFVSKKMGQWALQFTPHIILRMKNERSLPIKNPSYIVPLYFHHRLGFWNNSFLRQLSYDKAYATVSLSHHSNGQDGPTLWKSGNLNVKNGSFSTNYVSFALTAYKSDVKEAMPGFTSLKLYYERHLSWLGFEDTSYPYALEGLYGLDRVMVQYSNLDLSRKGDISPRKFLANSRFIGNAGWIFGTMRNTAPNDLNERLMVSLRYIYYPEWMDEIAFFADFYRGQDYYNMRFERNLSVFRIGLISDPLQLGSTSDLFD